MTMRMTAGKSDEWYTPPEVFDALRETFDLDVAAPPGGAPQVPARDFIAPPRDGLTEPWDGFVWMNAPFGRRNGLQPWLERFFEHSNGIALTPDRTSAPWFRYVFDHADGMLFVHKKLRFLREDLSPGNVAMFGTVLIAAGPRATQALQAAQTQGYGAYMARVLGASA